jgi:hypothetical protein
MSLTLLLSVRISALQSESEPRRVNGGILPECLPEKRFDLVLESNAFARTEHPISTPQREKTGKEQTVTVALAIQVIRSSTNGILPASLASILCACLRAQALSAASGRSGTRAANNGRAAS